MASWMLLLKNSEERPTAAKELLLAIALRNARLFFSFAHATLFLLQRR
jgi:hypothetical protein